MLQNIINFCREYPQIIIFLAIAIGYFVGKIKIYGFNFGSTAGVLIVALILGQIGLNIPPLVQTIGFALFIFCIGYQVGPQFFGALKTEGIKYIWLALVVAVAGLLIAVLLGKLFNFDIGTTAGLLGGAMTQSAIIGTADGAIKHLATSPGMRSTLESNVAVAYAITYLFGTAGLIVFFKLVPRLMKLDLKSEARKLEQQMNAGVCKTEETPELFSWSNRLDLRAYRVAYENIIGKTITELEAMFPKQVVVNKVKRNAEIFDPKVNANIALQLGDVVVLLGYRERFLEADQLIGPEVDDKCVTDLTGEILDICVLNPKIVGKTLGEISAMHNSHGLFLKRITRQGHEIPITKNTVVNKGDILQIAGTQRDVEAIIKTLGYPERKTRATDLILVGLGCVLGTLLGLIMVPIAGIPITLGIGGGVLATGLFAGWLRSIHPTFGQIPDGAQWIFTDLGLNLFIACVGLTAGAKAIHALQTTGPSLLFAGIILTLTPMIIGIIFGKYVLKLNPVLLFGGLTGAGTVTAALNAVKDEANSSAPALGYAVPFAFGNVLLTIWGTVIVNIMHVIK